MQGCSLPHRSPQIEPAGFTVLAASVEAPLDNIASYQASHPLFVVAAALTSCSNQITSLSSSSSDSRRHHEPEGVANGGFRS